MHTCNVNVLVQCAHATHADIIRRKKKWTAQQINEGGNKTRDEPGVCLAAIIPASEPEERAVKQDGGE
jgi:hypothetical protein